MTVIDLDALPDPTAVRAAYLAAEPFPHAVIDGLLRPDAYRAAAASFPGVDGPHWTNYVHVNERKFGNPHPETWGAPLRDVADALMSPPFVRFLEELTGIDALLADPDFDGGGLHRSVDGGFLNVHADFTAHHSRPRWRRRVNVLLYFNEDWSPAYRGDLELWDSSMRQRVATVAPIANRMVVFSTDERSFHGHPEPLRLPPGAARRSLALYYFTEEQAVQPRSTAYRSRPGDGVRRPLIWADAQILRAYDRTKRRLGLSDDVASRLLGRVTPRRPRRIRTRPRDSR